MHLILDFGNTLLKYFVFDGQEVVFQNQTNALNWEEIVKEMAAAFPTLEALMISDVSGVVAPERHSLFQGIPIFYCSSKLKLPFVNHYKTPQQLGADRIALMAAATLLYPKKNILVIDLGTCITYDFKDASNNYFGGAISPGFSIRYRSLSDYTGSLPKLQPETPKQWIGDTTASSMHSGIYHGILCEIQGQIVHYQKKYKDLTIILVGGDAQRLSKSLKNSIFAHSNFLAVGLNYILELNKKEC